MPELWLNYGSTDIILDVKVENLSLIENAKFGILNDESINQNIESISITDDTILIALDASNSTIQIISKLISLAGNNGITLSIESLPRTYNLLSKKIPNKNIVLCKKNNNYFLKRIEERNTIFISKTSIDPLFGYSGTPTNLIREFGENKMNEAYHSRLNDLPHPGKKEPPFEFAMMFCENMKAKSIEIISNNYGIHNFFYGEIIHSFQNAIEKINHLSLDHPELKSLIIGTNIDSGSSLTLSTSLDMLWNSIHILRKNGTAVLISESKQGFGSEALEKLAYGNMEFDYHKKSNYINGLEHIMFINELKDRYNIGILSSLPKYYLKNMFVFKIFSNIQEAVENILDINSKNHMISIIQDPNVAIFKNWINVVGSSSS